MSQCTVIIVNWNSWDILAHCLDKLQQQVFQDFRVVVIDNASSRQAPAQLTGRYPQIQFIANTENIGFAAANNQGILLPNATEYVVLLNPDAFPEVDWLKQLVEAAAKYPDYAAFASRQLMDGDTAILDGEGDVVHAIGLVWRDGYGKTATDRISMPREVFSPCAAAALYRREALRSVGGFDEDFFCYVEDVDLGFRLRLKGYRALLVPSAVVRHIGSATTGGQQSDFAVYHGHRNLVWMYVKDMPGPIFWLCLPLHLAMNLAVIVLFAFRGKLFTIIRAKRDAILRLPEMWRKRRDTQKARSVSVREIWRVLDKRFIFRW